MDKPTLQAHARELGIDALGVAPAARLEAALPMHLRPSTLTGMMRTVLVGRPPHLPRDDLGGPRADQALLGRPAS